jgi:hypothetical protein
LCTRGQSNFGKSAVFAGAVFVSESVYPDRPWNAWRKCSTTRLAPSSFTRSSPIFRAFQSKATLSAFSTASAPPVTQKWCGNPGGVTRVAKASTKSAISVVYRSALLGLFVEAACRRARNPGSAIPGCP